MDCADIRIRIVADDREPVGGTIAELRRRDDVALAVQRLPRGDFIVEDRFAIERKTLPDFAASVIDARLFRQAAALARGPQRGVLILEADPLLSEMGLTREAFQGAWITVTIFYGLPILRARDATETARLLVYLGRQARQFACGALPRPGYRSKGKPARQLFILQGLPRVGPERAKKLLERFGSVENVTRASREELCTVEGIGDLTAAKIRWALE